jgi:glycerophosphoryl diester phosphodiesterase
MRTFLTMLTLATGGLHAAEPFLVAHRGASHDAPENTLPAFELAWKQGADAIEGDFHLTADGKIVCVHDRSSRTAPSPNSRRSTPARGLSRSSRAPRCQPCAT